MLLNCQVEDTKLRDVRVIKSYMAITQGLKLHCRIREVVSVIVHEACITISVVWAKGDTLKVEV